MAKLSNRNIAILTENGFEEVELTSPKQALEGSGGIFGASLFRNAPQSRTS